MSFSSQEDFDRNAGAIEAEKTLRLIATLPAPEGIEERVKSRLRAAPRQARVISWPAASSLRDRWIPTSAIRAAAAAAIVIVVAGGGWEVYSHIRVAAQPTAVTVPQSISGQSGLSAAGTRRVPQTLEGPMIASPVMVKQKTNSHPAANPSGHTKAASTKKPAASMPAQP